MPATHRCVPVTPGSSDPRPEGQPPPLSRTNANASASSSCGPAKPNANALTSSFPPTNRPLNASRLPVQVASPSQATSEKAKPRTLTRPARCDAETSTQICRSRAASCYVTGPGGERDAVPAIGTRFGPDGHGLVTNATDSSDPRQIADSGASRFDLVLSGPPSAMFGGTAS
jgi:hypothetical protein